MATAKKVKKGKKKAARKPPKAARSRATAPKVKKKAKTKPAPKKQVRAARQAAKTVRSATRPPASPPRPDPLRELARRIVDMTVAGDDAASLALYSDSIESTESGMPPTHGLQAIREKFENWHNMVREASWRARSVAVGGNTIVIEWTGTVTFNATGKTIELNEIAVHEIANGKIVRERFYYNPAAMQAAMMPEEAPAIPSPPGATY